MLQITNTLSRKKEKFEPLNAPFVGMYVCGPTVYGDAHMGHARAAVTFDIVFRYLKYLGYKVRYVRNITDVGHLVNDSDSGEDKIAKKAKLENLEPMEVAQLYTNRYHNDMDKLNVLRPSIEPRASGHISEQIEYIQAILDNHYAYISNGSVYFDVKKYHEKYHYGTLSGRVIEDMMHGSRDLEGQDQKRNPLDFALWKKAAPEHIMRWNSPWSEGFPGWHIECSVMSNKYLGKYFDIHGGGMDLVFPHHESELAQAQACQDSHFAKYWLHNNMVTINGQKMGKSLNNFITLDELFEGSHELMEDAYSPMTLRFYILQAHYRGTLDVSNAALKAAKIAYRKLLNANILLSKLEHDNVETLDVELNTQVENLLQSLDEAMNDDFNTGIAISHLFALANLINSFHNKIKNINSINEQTFDVLKTKYDLFFSEILGLKEELVVNVNPALEALISLYKQAKVAKEYDKVDEVRKSMKAMGLVIKDTKFDVEWAYEV